MQIRMVGMVSKGDIELLEKMQIRMVGMVSKGDIELLEKIQVRMVGMVSGLKGRSYQENLKIYVCKLLKPDGEDMI